MSLHAKMLAVLGLVFDGAVSSEVLLIRRPAYSPTFMFVRPVDVVRCTSPWGLEIHRGP